MAQFEERTISLPLDQAAYIDAQVADGKYPSATDVILAGLRALQERETEIENWLRNDVLPVYDAMKANPSRALSPEQVSESLRAHDAEWRKSRIGG